jgi:hypothetical protein
MVPPGHGLDEARAMVDEAAAGAGRDPGHLGLEGRVSWGDGGAEKLAEQAARWQEAGATHLSINTMGAGLASIEDHLDALESGIQAIRR